MVTYVNSVLISNLASGAVCTGAPASSANFNTASDDFGKWVIITTDPINATDAAAEAATPGSSNYPYVTTSNYASKIAGYDNFKIGIVTNKNAVQHKPNGTTGYEPIVKWSNVINKNEVKSCTFSGYVADTQDTVTIDFSALNSSVLNLFDDGGKRIIVRLTFKDLPTRYRKWTESYEYVTKTGDTKATIAENIANLINKEYKRARVSATYVHEDADETTTPVTPAQDKVVLTALSYDDDSAVDTLNWANQVRFNANVYYTDPAAEGWESMNKHFPTGVTITKVPGKISTSSAKLVRDAEAQAMGYQGILNRGEGTWPIVKPEMQTDLSAQYDALTLEFETSYHAADDITRKTKQCVEMYGKTSQLSGLKTIVEAIAA